jgi:hypothetical protein
MGDDPQVSDEERSKFTFDLCPCSHLEDVVEKQRMQDFSLFLGSPQCNPAGLHNCFDQV